MRHPRATVLPNAWYRALAIAGFVVSLTLLQTVFAAPSTSTPRWHPPISPMVVSNPFDPPAQPWLAGHRGIDLVAAAGTTVTAVGDGQVTFVGKVVDRPVVVISHGELSTTYEPVDASVAVGQAVTAQQSIGHVAAGGHCDNSCLHLGLKRGEEYLNPEFLWARPAVLRPLESTP